MALPAGIAGSDLLAKTWCQIFANPIHSRVLVILGNSGVPSDKRGGTPGVGSAYLRIGILLLGITNYRPIDTLLVGRLMGKDSTHIKTLAITGA